MSLKESQKNTFLLVAFLFLLATSFVIEFNKQKQTSTKKTIDFWHYWSGVEKEPLEKLITKFNKENHGFKVNLLAISMPRKKILTAIIGNVAPDLVHIDNDMASDFALRHALAEISMQDFAKEKFTPIFLEALNFKQKQFAMPYLCGSEAMHYNKTIFEELNLKAPESLQDIEQAFSISLSQKDFPIFLPSWPSWFAEVLPLYFGGDWVDNNGQVSANSQANIEAWQWIEKNFIEKIPEEKILSFTEGFGAYQSPDNPFYSQKIALELNGIWEQNLAKIYAPNLNIAVKAFPGKIKNATLVRIDALAIPKNAKNKKEAQILLNWLLQKENLEFIALEQKKFTAYKTHSNNFFAKHENPYIKTFIELAQSKNAKFFPKLSFANRYKKEIRNAYDQMIRKQKTAKQALDELQEKVLATVNKRKSEFKVKF